MNISIIIPAHNEEHVIADTLAPLTENTADRQVEVIVVCNGCTDKTVELVNSFGDKVKCIETPVPSKANALNLGDAVATGYPRFYLDADVILSLDTVHEVTQVLQSGKFLAAAPAMIMDLRKASWIVRSYYDIWQRLPYVQEGMIGTGVYALSEEGRKRFTKFPHVISDDGFVRALFKGHERTSVPTGFSLVRAPSNFAGLLKIKTRSRLGLYELKRKFPEFSGNEDKKYGCVLVGLLCELHLWPKYAVYLGVNLWARARARSYLYQYGFSGWERDDSSRQKSYQ